MARILRANLNQPRRDSGIPHESASGAFGKMPMQARYLIKPDGVIIHSELVIDYVDRSSTANLRPLLETLW
jgi:hypothetical protein